MNAFTPRMWLVYAASFLLSTSTAFGARFAIIVGANQGPAPLVPLRYAHEDARKIQDILLDLGGVPSSNLQLLLEPDLEQLQSAMWRVTAAASKGDELIFYYSGHADDNGLLLRNEFFSQEELQSLLKDERFRIRLAVIDACKSGTFTRTKGGSFEAPLDIKWETQSETQGAVLITSSSADEASVERDDLGGSLFTHYWASALRGAADLNDDGRVTLNEAFSFSYQKTLMRSSESQSGLQHPHYDYEIQGRGELTLTKLREGATLIFPEKAIGTYLVFQRARGALVAEVDSREGEIQRISLPAGDYVVKKRIPNASLLTSISVSQNEQRMFSDSEMKTVPLTEDLSKGYETPIFEPTWRYGAPYPVFSAHTLRRGEWSLGLQRMQYGISDDVTVSSNLLLAVLGLPIFSAEFKIWQNPQWIWSLDFSTIQGFPKSSSPRGWHETRLETLLTYHPIPELQITFLTGWALESGPDEEMDTNPWEFQKAIGGLSLTWTPLDWFFLQASGKEYQFIYAGEDIDLPIRSGEVVAGLAWGAWRIMGGVRAGREHIFEEPQPLRPQLDLWVRW